MVVLTMNCKVCGNTSAKNASLSFYRFPKDRSKCREWAERCHLLGLFERYGPVKFYKSFRICSRHFDPKHVIFDGRKNKLLNCAIPHLLPGAKKPSTQDNVNYSHLKLFQKFCRLCAEEDDSVTEIFGWRGKLLNLENKLKYFPQVINKNDILPLKICNQCMQKVNQFYDFIVNCNRAEVKLRAMLDTKLSDSGTNSNQKPDRDSPVKETSDQASKVILFVTDMPDKMADNSNERPIRESVIRYHRSSGNNHKTPGTDHTNHITPGTDHTTPGTDNSTPNTDQTTPGTDLITPGIDHTTLGTDHTNHTTLGIDHTTPGSDQTTPDTDHTNHITLGTDNTILGTDHTTPGPILTTPGPILTTPGPILTTPGPTLTTPGPTLTTPGPILTTPGPTLTTPGPTLTTPGPILTTPGTNLTTPDTNHTTPSTDHTTLGTDLTTLGTDHTTLGTDHKTPNTPENGLPDHDYLGSQLLSISMQGTKFCPVLPDDEVSSAPSPPRATKSLNERRDKVPSSRFEPASRPEEKKCESTVRDNHDAYSDNHSSAPVVTKDLRSSPSKWESKTKRWMKRFREQISRECCESREKFSKKKVRPPHYKKHSEQAFQCTECGKCLTTKAGLRSHRSVHSDRRPYGCRDCGRFFRSKGALLNHRSVHSDWRPYSCRECGRSFRRKDGLCNHVRIHSGERPYLCKVCGFAFKQRGDCIKHEKNHGIDDRDR